MGTTSSSLEAPQPKARTYDWQGDEDALSLALEMEKEVTARMKLMIDVCSEAGAEDYHAGVWLTGTWLEEQYQGQRHLAGLINTFNNFKRGHEELQNGCSIKNYRMILEGLTITMDE